MATPWRFGALNPGREDRIEWFGSSLRLEQLLEGASAPQPYKSVEPGLQRPFGSDVDDLCQT